MESKSVLVSITSLCSGNEPMLLCLIQHGNQAEVILPVVKLVFRSAHTVITTIL